DIRRIYFDLLPSQNAPLWKRKYKFIYRQSYDQGYLEFIFAGVDGDLIEKNYYENHQPIGCVSNPMRSIDAGTGDAKERGTSGSNSGKIFCTGVAWRGNYLPMQRCFRCGRVRF